MSQFPSLPLFTDAYFGDTKHLTCEEHGAYLQLIMIAWRSPGCGIPNDDAKIARMIGLTAKRWQSIKPTVMAFWSLDDDGLWKQSRLTKERLWVAERSEKRAAAGKLGGRPKSLENNDQAKAKGSFSESKAKAPNPNPREEEYSDTNVSSHSRRERKNPWPSDYREQVWAIYPKHDEKKDGMIALDAIHKADKIPFAVIVAGINRLASHVEEPRFAPALHRWLKKERWNDEYQPRGATPPRTPPPGQPQPRRSAQANFLDIARDADAELNNRTHNHERPFDGEILGPSHGNPPVRYPRLAVYERAGSEAGEPFQESHPFRARAFG